MKNLPTLFFATGALFALIGMLWGIDMSISQDHSLAPAHAHLNLIGFVTMSIFGTFYALSPVAAKSRLAKVHFGLTTFAVSVMVPGIALAVVERTEVPVKIGSVLALLSMAILLFMVLHHGMKNDAPR